jgi:hypothetical protein
VIGNQEMGEVVLLADFFKFIIPSFFYFPLAECNFKQVLQVTLVFILHAAGKLVNVILALVYIFMSLFFQRGVHVFHLGCKPIARRNVNFICGEKRCGI